MSEKTTKLKTYEPQELKTLFDALNSAPSWLSKRFVLRHMLGWSEEHLRTNMQLRDEEITQQKMGNKGSYYQ